MRQSVSLASLIRENQHFVTSKDIIYDVQEEPGHMQFIDCGFHSNQHGTYMCFNDCMFRRCSFTACGSTSVYFHRCNSLESEFLCNKESSQLKNIFSKVVFDCSFAQYIQLMCPCINLHFLSTRASAVFKRYDMSTDVRITCSTIRKSKLFGCKFSVDAFSHFTDCDLRLGNLDPELKPNGLLPENTEVKDGYVYGYRTAKNCTGKDYLVGECYSAPYFDVSDTICAPGLYFFPSVRQVFNYLECNKLPLRKVIKIRTKQEFVHTPDHGSCKKARCKWFEVVEEVHR